MMAQRTCFFTAEAEPDGLVIVRINLNRLCIILILPKGRGFFSRGLGVENDPIHLGSGNVQAG
jgi:hypothetical protein